jgi:hypothetical protein
MQRIIIDSQSNGLLRGSALEQRYDQRGGLCQVGAGHLVLTTDPVDRDFLDYWQRLGFSLPRLMAVGPFHPGRTLSELILADAAACEAIRRMAADGPARLEFFCIEETERALAQALDVPAYCNFDLARAYASKLAFKALCAELGLATAPWFHDPDPKALVHRGAALMAQGRRVLVKTETGMGGVGCGGMAAPADSHALERAVRLLALRGGALFLETRLEPLSAELSVHWEITADGQVAEVSVFDSINVDNSYRGTAHPPENAPGLAEAARRTVLETLGPHLAARGALGFFCCDILADQDGTLHWNDFNPRKGASIYVRDMVRRLRAARLGDRPVHYWHEGLRLRRGLTVAQVLDLLHGLLEPGPEPFLVLSNPGITTFARADLTAISATSRAQARHLLNAARARLDAA